jgi:hypothetical protein
MSIYENESCCESNCYKTLLLQLRQIVIAGEVVRRILAPKNCRLKPSLCNGCGESVSFESATVCADEYGEPIHVDCHIQMLIASSRLMAALQP